MLLTGKLPKTTRQFPQTAAGSTEAFVHIGFAGKQPERNLANIETTEGLQSQDELRFHGDCFVAADKEHPQQVVPHLPRQEDLRTVLRSTDVFHCVLLQDATAGRSLAQLSHEMVVRHPKEPGPRIVRQTRNRPRLERGHQGGLNGVLNSLDVWHSHPARQRGNKPAVFVPEEVLNQLGRRQAVLISLTSTLEPGIPTPGL
jgi:hypothetical protein